MEIWVVEGGFNYETSTVFAVVSTEDKADKMVKKIKRESIYDWVGRSKHVVDKDEECEGHESLNGADMGRSVYCDGPCR